MKYSTGIVEKKGKFYIGRSMIALDFVPVDPFTPSTRFYVDSVLWDDEENCRTYVLMVDKPMQEEREGRSQSQTHQCWVFGHFHKVSRDLQLELVQWWSDDREDIKVEMVTTKGGRKVYEHLMNEGGYVPHVGTIDPDFFKNTFWKEGPTKKVLWTASDSGAVYSYILSIDGKPVEINLISDTECVLAINGKSTKINLFPDAKYLSLKDTEWLIVGLPEICIDNRGRTVIFMNIEGQQSGLRLRVFTSEFLAPENKWKVEYVDNCHQYLNLIRNYI